jgi:hypothetical protein
MIDRIDPRSDANARSGGRVVATTLLLMLALVGMHANGASAASPVGLGTADSFAVLGGSTITNTGPSVVSGDIGLCCSGLATPGFGSLTQPSGAQYVGPGSVAASAQDDLDVAYANAAGQAVTSTVPVDLSLTGTAADPLLPGVYQTTAHGALQINTGLTLDFQGNPNAVFIFQGTTLATAVGAGGSVTIVNGGSAPSTCNIYWQLSDETQGVTLGAASAFKGTTMALGASVLGTGATVQGRILTRRSKAVTLDANTIARSPCFVAPATGGGSGDTPPPSTNTPSAPPQSSAPRPTAVSLDVTPAVTPAAGAAAGTAHISGPSGPVRGPFTVTVTGHAIQSVVFSIDGRRATVVHAKPGRTKFKLAINPRRQGHGVHRVTARVTFHGRDRKTTLRLTYRRPSSPGRGPRFTG